jgi:hypothetical protein
MFRSVEPTREARRTHGVPRRRLGQHGRAAVAPFRDAAHRRSLRARGASARDRREGKRLHLLELGKARSGAAWICSARCDGGEPAARRNQPRCALDAVNEKYDRIIVITDEQSHDRVPAPKGKGYVINVASARNGVGYGAWSHIDGWSEAVIDYIRELERTRASRRSSIGISSITSINESNPKRYCSVGLSPVKGAISSRKRARCRT